MPKQEGARGQGSGASLPTPDSLAPTQAKRLLTPSPSDPDFALTQAVDPDRLPAHIAIIMDGNGRWAKRRGLPRVAGHRAGIQPVRVTVETCARLGLRALTLYAFS